MDFSKIFKALLLHVDTTRKALEGIYLKVNDNDEKTFSLCATNGNTGLIVRNLDSELDYGMICATVLHEYGLILPENPISGTMYIGKMYKVAIFTPEDDQNLAFPNIEKVFIKGETENPLENFPAFGFKQLGRADKTFTLILGKDVIEAYIPHRWIDDVHITEYDITDDIMLFVMPVSRSIKD